MDKMKDIPFVVYESSQARNERTIKRLVAVIIIITALLFASNLAWLYTWTQCDYSGKTEDYWQDGDGYNNINTGEQGDINNGAKAEDPAEN